jgi:hypothetical protein
LFLLLFSPKKSKSRGKGGCDNSPQKAQFSNIFKLKKQ